jgi:integrase
VRYRKPDHSSTDKRGFKRKKDAEEWAAEHVVTAMASKTYVDPRKSRVQIRDLYEAWFEEHSPLWSDSWRNTVRISWKTHVEPQWGSMRLHDVDRATVQKWVNSLSDSKSASTVLKAYGVLRGIIVDAIRDRRLVADPLKDVNLPRKPKRKQRRNYLTVEQLLAFSEECGKAQEKGDERRALVLMLGFCGLRWGEAAALKVDAVDFEHRRINVVGNLVKVGKGWSEGDPKNGEDRSVPMPTVVAKAMECVCDHKAAGDRVFTDPSGNPIRAQSVGDVGNNRTWYVSALKRLGYAHRDMPSPHDLRHTAASIAVHAGANVKALQRMLGHASAAMTLDVYADLFDSDLDAVASSIDKAVDECGQKVGKNSPSDTGAKSKVA